MLDRLIHPPMSPEQFQEPRWARFLFTSATAAWLWLVVRLYMAWIWVPAGFEKVTEGVETRSEHDTLVGLGVRVGQGFLYARPAPARDLVAADPVRRASRAVSARDRRPSQRDRVATPARGIAIRS
jgi:hypothetical protein